MRHHDNRRIPLWVRDMSSLHNRGLPRSLLFLSLAACSPKAAIEPAPSAAITADFTLADSATVTFGMDQDRMGLDLSTATSVQLLSDGRLALVCCKERVLIYSANGNFESSFGGRGEGPGQFQWAKMTVLPGDTLLVYDGSSRRATWIDPSVGVVRSAQLRSQVPSAYRTTLGVTPDGAVILTSMHGIPNTPRPSTHDSVRTVAEVVAAYPDGTRKILFDVLDVLVTPRQAPLAADGVMMMDLVRYGGVASVQVRNDTFHVLPGGSRQLQVRVLADSMTRNLSLSLPRAVVSAESKASYIESEIAPILHGDPSGHAPPPDPEAVIHSLRTAVFSDSFPPANDLLLDMASDDLWVVQGRATDATQWWATKITPTGETTATLQSDIAGSMPLAFKGNTVLLKRVDETGVTWFELRHIVPRPNAAN
jgi:hypothetical protein